jgi:hypothetical protein
LPFALQGAGIQALCLLRLADLLHRRLLADGPVRVPLKRAWSNGTTHLLLEPLDCLEKLAALTPRPEVNLVLSTTSLPRHATV